MDLLIEESDLFYTDVEAANKELEAAHDFLNVDTLIEPSLLIDASNYKYEKPDNFIARTVNPAPGQLVFDELHSYVDNNLNLNYI